MLARAQGQLISMMVEGNVDEQFGDTLVEWRKSESTGRQRRLVALLEYLGLRQPIPGHIRYQLIHRAASAVIEALRFNAPSAVMVVHSFSETDKWFDDYRAFLALFGVQAKPNTVQISAAANLSGLPDLTGCGHERHCVHPAHLPTNVFSSYLNGIEPKPNTVQIATIFPKPFGSGRPEGFDSTRI